MKRQLTVILLVNEILILSLPFMFTDELDQRTVEVWGCLNWKSPQMHHVHLKIVTTCLRI